MDYDKAAYNRLSDLLKIDPEYLDEDICMHADSYFHASEGAVYHKAVRDKAKHDLELEMATLDRDIRDAAAANEEKLTEPGIKMQTLREPDYQRALDKHLRASHEAAKWDALQESFKQRSYMLGHLNDINNRRMYNETGGISNRTRGEASERVNARRRD
jgi:hypothetical protein